MKTILFHFNSRICCNQSHLNSNSQISQFHCQRNTQTFESLTSSIYRIRKNFTSTRNLVISKDSKDSASKTKLPKKLNEKKQIICGVDEAGRGAVIGPLIIGFFFENQKNLLFIYFKLVLLFF